MKKIIYIADGAAFNSRQLAAGPLGGAESACIHFVSSLARNGFDVTVYTTATDHYDEGRLHWRPLADFVPTVADMVFAHRSPHLFAKYPIIALRRLLYLHNPASYLSKWKHRKYLYRYKPEVIFSGTYHASTWPKLLPKSPHHILPYAIDPLFTHATQRNCPSPKAIFTSNPLRSLDWLLATWEQHIHPLCPTAELHLYCGPEVYPNLKPQKAAAMRAVIDQAQRLADKGVVINQPVPREQLVALLSEARVMLYRGDPGESFCLALGEAQAMGVPAVTEGIGSCKERVVDGLSGYIASGQAEFGRRAVALLSDDQLWQQQHQFALAQHNESWDEKVQRLFASEHTPALQS